ncbi:MAG: AAA family ATPase [Candidatus Dojkabacteria bacterium]|nr:AAA family ATPase [Candidatus Dojkabacteria bacterium]
MILSIINQKGGVGKTTTVLNLGVFLGLKGKKILLIDSDPQSNLTYGLGYMPKDIKTSIYDVYINKSNIQSAIVHTKNTNVDLVPSSLDLAGAEIELINAISRETILKKNLNSISENYDFIIIDCPPSLGLLTINALVAVEKIIIPVQTEYFALEGLGQLIKIINLVKNSINNKLEIGGVLLTMADQRTNLSKDVEKEVRNYFGDIVFNTIIPRNIKLSEAPSRGMSIYEYAKQSPGAISYEKLSEEFIQKFCKNDKLTRPNLMSKTYEQ